MGLAKTSGADEGGSEIKVEAGADDTGMESQDCEQNHLLSCQPLESAVVDSNFCWNALLKLNHPDVVAFIYICELNLFRPPNWSACFFPHPGSDLPT